MYKKLHTYFVGIGGIGMSGIAEILLNLGYPVSGSDMKQTNITKRLKRLGAKIYIGHQAKNIQNIDVVVASSAIKTTNPEIVAAKKQNIQVIQRAEMLAQIMRLAKYGIAVAGTHGKTTTTSILASVLQAGKVDPTIIIGGKVKSLRSTAKLGKGDFMLAEADESDGSFLKLMPTIAVVTNMDHEHMDHYGSFENYRLAFQTFCNQIPFYGLNILCGEDSETHSLSKKIKTRYVLYGFSPRHDYNARNLTYQGTLCQYELYHKDTFVDKIILSVPGKHNVLNSLACIAVAEEIGMNLNKIKKGLAAFKGVGRRLEILFKNSNITAIDDYGHHPSEILATLKTVKQAFPGRLVVLFQPHRYSRTKDLFGAFVNSFDKVDHLFITSIYAASESPIKGISGKNLADKIRKRNKTTVDYVPQTKTIVNKVLAELKQGDVFLSLGAGDVTYMSRNIARELAKRFI
ncbi:MAG: UDP-N-acetylmuramate--L-alanine ligase [bacterium]|nr:UDP-N-acetylmuramate--L-alanine ligase [bacterium]MBU1918474.1 UDP-N-acetylmuramate--L-alanine ligase [bacterium]